MNGEQVWLWVAAGGAAALLLLVLACALLWRRASHLATRLDDLEARLGEQRVPTSTDASGAQEASPYVITGLPDGRDQTSSEEIHVGRIDGALFADIVARETTIKAAGLAHGLRRALSAQSRNRIRFEMRQQVRRSRKQRRADLKTALRDLQAREDAA
ncbi:hypothetical protein [Nocardioides piscis]|uniref:Uncharacterized protein n=1 Tax=Nocardioides piscis TaxID=2714938 RepID=A0A6G7YJ33_9ACTN|nr:hypothetical protein [Nocardioides piscis]QIK76746.1 hypothetical protein G7071_16250 [Nocardioides piscis]